MRTFSLEMRIVGGEFPPEKLFGSCWVGLDSLCLLEGTAGWGWVGADKVDGVIYRVIYKLYIVALEFTRPLCFLLLLCNYYT